MSTKKQAAKEEQLMITVQEAAKQLGKTDGRIRQICREHDLGHCYNARLRLLSEKDLQFMQKLINERGKSFSHN